MVSCCTGEVLTGDYDICPECHEHCGEDTCPDCEGTGEVEDEKTDFADTVDVQAKAEMLSDMANDR
jgi:DnaJ-class molecular chaperone